MPDRDAASRFEDRAGLYGRAERTTLPDASVDLVAARFAYETRAYPRILEH